jgi:hypothetical protein
LQIQNKLGNKCDTVLDDPNHKKDCKEKEHSKKFSKVSSVSKSTDNHKVSDNTTIKSDVSKLVTNATSSIIEKDCIQDSIDKDNNLEDFKAKHNYQIVEDYWRIRKKECEKTLSKFC